MSAQQLQQEDKDRRTRITIQGKTACQLVVYLSTVHVFPVDTTSVAGLLQFLCHRGLKAHQHGLCKSHNSSLLFCLPCTTLLTKNVPPTGCTPDPNSVLNVCHHKLTTETPTSRLCHPMLLHSGNHASCWIPKDLLCPVYTGFNGHAGSQQGPGLPDWLGVRV